MPERESEKATDDGEGKKVSKGEREKERVIIFLGSQIAELWGMRRPSV